MNELFGGIVMKRLVEYGLCLIFILTFSRIGIWAAEPDNDNILESQQAVSQALESDLALQAARLELEIAQKDLGAAKRIFNIAGGYSIKKTDTSDWLTPTQNYIVSSGGVYDPNYINPKWVISYTPTNDQNDYEYGLTLYPFNMAYEKSIKMAELAYINKILAYENTRIKLITEVRNAYAEAVQKEELYKLAAEDLDLSRDRFEKTNTLFNIGKIPRLDLMDAEQQVKAAEVKRISADLNRQAGLLKLSTLLRKEELKGVILQGKTLIWATTDQIDLQTTIDQYLKTGFDIKAVSLNVQVAKIQQFMDSCYLLKNLNIGLEVNKPNDQSSTTMYSVGFWGQLDDSYFRNQESSKKKLEAAKFSLEVITRNKQTQIAETYRTWKIMELNLTPMQDSLNVAKERLRIANVKYENGMTSSSDVNQARMMLTKAQEDYWNTWFGLQQARESFYQATGGNPALKPEVAK
jgi:outer membrane protein TolC